VKLAEGKVCTVCKTFKLATEFGFKKYVRKDGVESVYLKSRCTKCRYKSEICSEEQRLAFNKKAAENRLKRLAAMTEAELEAYKAKQKQMQQAWKDKDREKYSELRKKWHLKWRDKEVAYKRQRYIKKKDELDAKCREYYLRRHIPTSLVEVKRIQLMILRSLRNEKR
jgi:hypothetical protein